MDRVPTGGDLVVRYVYSVGRIVGHKYGVILKKRQEECDLYFGDPSLTLFEILIDGVIEHVPKRTCTAKNYVGPVYDFWDYPKYSVGCFNFRR